MKTDYLYSRTQNNGTITIGYSGKQVKTTTSAGLGNTNTLNLFNVTNLKVGMAVSMDTGNSIAQDTVIESISNMTVTLSKNLQGTVQNGASVNFGTDWKNTLTVTELSGTGSRDVQVDSDGKLTVAASDRRLKKNIVYLDSTIDKIIKLKPCTFEWKDDDKNNTVIGLIAQDVEKVIPEAVYENESNGMKGLQYKYITATMIKGMQEQQEIINQQKEKIEKQQTEIDSLKIQMAAILARLENLEK